MCMNIYIYNHIHLYKILTKKLKQSYNMANIFNYFTKLSDNLQDEKEKGTFKYYCNTCDKIGRKTKQNEKIICRIHGLTTSNLIKHLNSDIKGHAEVYKEFITLQQSESNNTPNSKKRKLDLSSPSINSSNLISMGSVTIKQKYKQNDYNQREQ